MTKGKLALSTLVLALTAGVPVPSEAADTGFRTRPHHHRYVRHYRRIILPPERHVIEVARPGGSFVINGRSFAATTQTCARWAAGEPVKLIAGDWNSACSPAVFYNVWRRQSCEMWCR